jgi:hypothetical protein
VRILGCDEVLYTGLAHRNRAAATAASFGVAANVKLVLARRVQRALVRHIEARLEFDDRMVMPL